MDIDAKEKELKEALAQLGVQYQQNEQAKNNLVTEILKKQGALELLQGLKDEPAEETTK